jgi:excinuclease UvrABC ATPase subunit
MVFMADVITETCNGKRFKKKCLVAFAGKTYMTFDYAVAFFETNDQQHKITQNSNHCKMLD